MIKKIVDEISSIFFIEKSIAKITVLSSITIGFKYVINSSSENSCFINAGVSEVYASNHVWESMSNFSFNLAFSSPFEASAINLKKLFLST